MHRASSMEQLSSSEKARTNLARAVLRGRSSKYDMVKVKVFLGDQLEHYYVLSRFLISRMLTVTRIPNGKATKIALDLKKHLVDHNLLEVKQADLEAILFRLMDAKGFGEQHVSCYRLVSSFMAARQPLVILLCGAPWTGKSTITQQLAARLNMPNVLRTELVYTLLRDGGLLPKYAPPSAPIPSASPPTPSPKRATMPSALTALMPSSVPMPSPIISEQDKRSQPQHQHQQGQIQQLQPQLAHQHYLQQQQQQQQQQRSQHEDQKLQSQPTEVATQYQQDQLQQLQPQLERQQQHFQQHLQQQQQQQQQQHSQHKAQQSQPRPQQQQDQLQQPQSDFQHQHCRQQHQQSSQECQHQGQPPSQQQESEQPHNQQPRKHCLHNQQHGQQEHQHQSLQYNEEGGAQGGATEAVGLHRHPVYARSDLQGEAALLKEFQRECSLVQHALEGDLNKAITDGKPLILEGGHLDPGLLLHKLTRLGLVMLPACGAEEAWAHHNEASCANATNTTTGTAIDTPATLDPSIALRQQPTQQHLSSKHLAPGQQHAAAVASDPHGTDLASSHQGHTVTQWGSHSSQMDASQAISNPEGSPSHAPPDSTLLYASLGKEGSEPAPALAASHLPAASSKSAPSPAYHRADMQMSEPPLGSSSSSSGMQPTCLHLPPPSTTSAPLFLQQHIASTASSPLSQTHSTTGDTRQHTLPQAPPGFVEQAQLQPPFSPLSSLSSDAPPHLPLSLLSSSNTILSPSFFCRTTSSSGPEADSPLRNPFPGPPPPHLYPLQQSPRTQPHPLPHFPTSQPHHQHTQYHNPHTQHHRQHTQHHHSSAFPSSGVDDSMSTGTGYESLEGNERWRKERAMMRGCLPEGGPGSSGSLSGSPWRSSTTVSSSSFVPSASWGILHGPVVAWPFGRSSPRSPTSNSNNNSCSPLPHSRCSAPGHFPRPQSVQGVLQQAETGGGSGSGGDPVPCTHNNSPGMLQREQEGGGIEQLEEFQRAVNGRGSLSRVPRHQSVPTNLAGSAVMLQQTGTVQGIAGTHYTNCTQQQQQQQQKYHSIEREQQQQQQQEQQSHSAEQHVDESGHDGEAAAQLTQHTHPTNVLQQSRLAPLMQTHPSNAREQTQCASLLCEATPALQQSQIVPRQGEVTPALQQTPFEPPQCEVTPTLSQLAEPTHMPSQTRLEQLPHTGPAMAAGNAGGGWGGVQQENDEAGSGMSSRIAGSVHSESTIQQPQKHDHAWQADMGLMPEQHAQLQHHDHHHQQQQQRQQQQHQHQQLHHQSQGAAELPKPSSSPEPHFRASTHTRAIQPLFVPIILQMPSEAEHALMAEDCAPDIHHASMTLPALKHTCSSIGRSGGSANAGSESVDQPPLLPSLPLKEQLQRARRMQQYFTSFEALQGVPVVQVKYGSFGETVDMLHQYILTCITTAMEWMQENEQLQQQQQQQQQQHHFPCSDHDNQGSQSLQHHSQREQGCQEQQQQQQRQQQPSNGDHEHQTPHQE